MRRTGRGAAEVARSGARLPCKTLLESLSFRAIVRYPQPLYTVHAIVKSIEPGRIKDNLRQIMISHFTRGVLGAMWRSIFALMSAAIAPRRRRTPTAHLYTEASPTRAIDLIL